MQKMCIGNHAVQVNNEQEALFLACEMERRAVQVYERGVLVCREAALKDMLARFWGEEKEHLDRFSQMGKQLEDRQMDEQQLLLSAYAAQILFPGGLMQAKRAGALDDAASLLIFARDSEATAVKCYESFSASCENPEAQRMFLAIAKEEQGHLDALVLELKKLGTE